MRLMSTLAMLFAVVAISFAEEKKDGFDAAKLVGNWIIESGTKNGGKISENATKSKIEITKEKMMLTGDDAKFVFKYTIDAKASPMAIDLEITESPFGAGMKAKGIIELKGDEMKLCYTSEGDRPTKFDGEKAFLFNLKKAKAEKK